MAEYIPALKDLVIIPIQKWYDLESQDKMELVRFATTDWKKRVDIEL